MICGLIGFLPFWVFSPLAFSHSSLFPYGLLLWAPTSSSQLLSRSFPFWWIDECLGRTGLIILPSSSFSLYLRTYGSLYLAPSFSSHASSFIVVDWLNHPTLFAIISVHSSYVVLFAYWSSTVTLHDIVHTEKSLTLVFEYLEKDLKQYMDDCGSILSMNNVKVCTIIYNFKQT